MGRESILFHPGDYCFRWPFFSWASIPDDDGNIVTHYCDVKVIIGDERDLGEGKLVTVVIYPLREYMGTTNYYASIASGIRNGVIRSIFHEYTRREDPLSDKDIRWIEVYSEDYIKGILDREEYREATMTWDDKAKRYFGSDFKIVQFEERYKKKD